MHRHGRGHRDFYPRSPCGERPIGVCARKERSQFLSTLSLRRATRVKLSTFWTITFLSTLSLRRATGHVLACGPCRIAHFYPRSPCGERRRTTRRALHSPPYFYPRSPCGERRWIPVLTLRTACYFYPRSPCGERRKFLPTGILRRYFYPRSPCGERQQPRPTTKA